ncbi:MAG TPA: hypothetical protein VEI28_01615, partial [Thermodesulfovibrionales bacterium]|nr:hypothetical protein [Thermodesulfovibrionales bacterium]
MSRNYTILRLWQMWFICSSLIVFIVPKDAVAEVVVSDMIGQKGYRVMLKAQTKGTLFSQGGKLVEFLIDGKSIGHVLSGGDGLAFKQYTPLEPGIYRITAKSG